MAGERMAGDVGGRGPARGAAERGSFVREGERLPENEQARGALRALFDSALDAVLVATDDREYVDANPAACELLGTSREELLGSKLEDFVPEGQQDAARAAWGEFLERGRMEGEIALRRADGAFRVAEFRARAEFLPGRHLSVLRDVTERKRHEEALRESEEQHRLIVENALDYGIFTTDPGGRIETWPPGAAAVYGWAAEEFIGQPVAVTYVPEDRASGKLEEELEIARREGVAPDVRWHLRKDGSRVFIEGTTRHLTDAEGGTRGFLKIGQDVTERRKLEREREQLRARELTARAEAAEREHISRELHDRVAHSIAVAYQSLELYAPLAEIAPARAQEKLELAKETTRRALDQARSLAAELRRMQGEELKDGMQAAFEALAETSVPNGVEIEISVLGEGSRIPKPVGVQVYLAMREAVRNAVKHSGCGRIHMRLTVGEDEVVGVVEDDGEGFEPEAVGRATPSWGVGLRSMRERAEMLGGTLGVDSRPGEGTKVEVRVPLDGRP